jgi:hypothetical protein
VGWWLGNIAGERREQRDWLDRVHKNEHLTGCYDDKSRAFAWRNLMRAVDKIERSS